MVTYDDIAEWYDQWVGTRSMREDPYFPTVEAFMGEVAGRRVCDLACGQGRVARYLADLGARVVGIDLSAKLLEIARHHEETEPRGIEYRQVDAHRLDAAALDPFDGVVCHMALMDIPDLPSTLRGVASLLQPGGWFVFSILHPCFHTAQSGDMETSEGPVRTIGHYFEEGWWRSDARPGPPGKVGAYHRTLSTYVNALGDAGLQVVRMSEPTATPGLPGSLPRSDVGTAILVAACRRSAP